MKVLDGLFLKALKKGYDKYKKVSGGKGRAMSAFRLYKDKLYTDGQLHVIELSAVEPANNDNDLMIDDEYTNYINTFLDCMRNAGHQIVHINTTVRPVINSHMTSVIDGWTRYNTELQYK